MISPFLIRLIMEICGHNLRIMLLLFRDISGVVRSSKPTLGNTIALLKDISLPTLFFHNMDRLRHTL